MSPEPYVPYGETSWPNQLVDSEDVSRFLGIKPTSLQQLVLRKAFPAPRTPHDGRRSVWAMGTVLQFALQHRPGRATYVPMIFPRTERPIPALFAGAHLLGVRTAGAINSYVAYLWVPSGLPEGSHCVAVVYNLSANNAQHRPQDVLRALQSQRYDVSAVVMPVRAGSVDDEDGQPPEFEVLYADDCGCPIPIGPLTWCDVTHLLQTAIPWWPPALRQGAAMLGWQPGMPPQPVVPWHPIGGDPHALVRLAASASSHAERDVAGPFFQWWAHRAASDGCATEPPIAVAGLHAAAYAVAPVAGVPLRPPPQRDRPTAAQTDRVLRVRVDPSAYDSTVGRLVEALQIWAPGLEAVFRIDPATSDQSVQQWLTRLHDDDGPVDELGYLHLCWVARRDQHRRAPLATHKPQRLTHPDRQGWITRFGDTVYVAVPGGKPGDTAALSRIGISTRDGTGIGGFVRWQPDEHVCLPDRYILRGGRVVDIDAEANPPLPPSR